eukprot:1371258-Prorocentrum_lima.AAC.1
MTSSLVGSEMCIRDRLKKTWIWNIARLFNPWEETAQSHHNAVVGQKEDCLLYTSDAADDM